MYRKSPTWKGSSEASHVARVCWTLTLGLDTHDDVIKWKHFSRYWPFVWGIHRSPVNFPHKSQWRGAWGLSLICTWTNGWVGNRDAGDLRRHRAYYEVTVMNRRKPLFIMRFVSQDFSQSLAGAILVINMVASLWNLTSASVTAAETLDKCQGDPDISNHSKPISYWCNTWRDLAVGPLTA